MGRRPWRCFCPGLVSRPACPFTIGWLMNPRISGAVPGLSSALRFRCAGAGRGRPRRPAHRPTVRVGRGGPEYVRLFGSHAVRRISRSASSCHAVPSSSRRLVMRPGDCSAAICCFSRPIPVGRRSPTSDCTEGAGMMIDASQRHGRVRRDDLSDRYWVERFMFARRVGPQAAGNRPERRRSEARGCRSRPGGQTARGGQNSARRRRHPPRPQPPAVGSGCIMGP